MSNIKSFENPTFSKLTSILNSAATAVDVNAGEIEKWSDQIKLLLNSHLKSEIEWALLNAALLTRERVNESCSSALRIIAHDTEKEVQNLISQLDLTIETDFQRVEILRDRLDRLQALELETLHRAHRNQRSAMLCTARGEKYQAHALAHLLEKTKVVTNGTQPIDPSSKDDLINLEELRTALIDRAIDYGNEFNE